MIDFIQELYLELKNQMGEECPIRFSEIYGSCVFEVIKRMKDD